MSITLGYNFLFAKYWIASERELQYMHQKKPPPPLPPSPCIFVCKEVQPVPTNVSVLANMLFIFETKSNARVILGNHVLYCGFDSTD